MHVCMLPESVYMYKDFILMCAQLQAALLQIVVRLSLLLSSAVKQIAVAMVTSVILSILADCQTFRWQNALRRRMYC